MVPQINRDDLARDLEATFAARHEIGPHYDEHFISALSDHLATQIQRQVQWQVQRATRHALQHPSRGKRAAFALGSLLFGSPIVAIGASLGLAGFAAACLLIVAINVAFALLP